jgi:hypothetical protein
LVFNSSLPFKNCGVKNCGIENFGIAVMWRLKNNISAKVCRIRPVHTVIADACTCTEYLVHLWPLHHLYPLAFSAQIDPLDQALEVWNKGITLLSSVSVAPPYHSRTSVEQPSKKESKTSKDSKNLVELLEFK